MSNTPIAPFPTWNDAHAASLDEPGLLLYRSNLLGSDLRITNYGGGNTSAKLQQKDPLSGQDSTVTSRPVSGSFCTILAEVLPPP